MTSLMNSPCTNHAALSRKIEAEKSFHEGNFIQGQIKDKKRQRKFVLQIIFIQHL